MGALQVYPPDLRFAFELGKELTTTMFLANTGHERLAFKVMTTSPEKYCVRPCMGIIEANSSVQATVILQAYAEVPHDLHHCEDKFLVNSRVVPRGVQQVTDSTFPNDAGEGLHEVHLNVSLELPNSPLLLGRLALQTLGSSPDEDALSEEDAEGEDAPESDGSEADDGTGVHRFFSANADFASVAKDALMDHLDKIMKERDELKRQVVILSPRGGPDSMPDAQVQCRTRKEKRSILFSWPVLVALVGSFFLGRLTA